MKPKPSLPTIVPTRGRKIQRIADPAFQHAQKRRKKLTLVDKANVLETSRLWWGVVQEIAGQYPDVAVDFLFVDNAAMQIILNPAQFDVVLTENMFGDIISDEASVISGSLGLLPVGQYRQAAACSSPFTARIRRRPAKTLPIRSAPF